MARYKEHALEDDDRRGPLHLDPDSIREHGVRMRQCIGRRPYVYRGNNCQPGSLLWH